MNRSEAASAHVVLILGGRDHRAWAATQLLNLLGMAMDICPQPTASNYEETTFWEHPRFTAIHRTLLRTMGSDWDDLRPLPAATWNHPNITPFLKALKTQCEGSFNGKKLWGVKDPNLSRLVPLWERLLEPAGISPVILYILTNPLHEAELLAREHGWSKGRACLLWLRNLLDGEKNTRHLRRWFVTTDDLVNHWQGFVRESEKRWELPWPKRLSQVIQTPSDTSKPNDEAPLPFLVPQHDLVNWIQSAYKHASQEKTPAGSRLHHLLPIETELTALDAPSQGMIPAKTTSPVLANPFPSRTGRPAVPQPIGRPEAGKTAHLTHSQPPLPNPRGQDGSHLSPTNKRSRLLRHPGNSAAVKTGYHSARPFPLVGLKKEKLELTQCAALCDSSFYFRRYPDVARHGVEPLNHYFHHGAGENRNPHPLFDTAFYRLQMTLPLRFKINPLAHYVFREDKCDPHPWFRNRLYLLQYPDVARAGINPLAHFLARGRLEKRDPNPLFDTAFYLQQAPDVDRSGINPLAHYAEYGSGEKRRFLPFETLAQFSDFYLNLNQTAPTGEPMRLVPVHQLENRENRYYSLGTDPIFHLIPKRGHLPTGWVMFSCRGSAIEGVFRYRLYLDLGRGFTSTGSISLAENTLGPALCLLRFPPCIRGLRLDPMETPGVFTLEEPVLRKISSAEAIQFLARRSLIRLLNQQGIPHHRAMTRILDLMVRKFDLNCPFLGLESAYLQQFSGHGSLYDAWTRRYDRLDEEDREAIRLHMGQMTWKPKFSVIMPVFDPPAIFLEKAIQSVRRQLYYNWELCIADDASTRPEIRQILENAQREDPRIKVVFRPENGHIAAASNSALKLARGEFLALLDHDDVLSEHALYMVAERLNRAPKTDLIYTDEDKIDNNGRRFDPYFKTDWNPDLFYSQNMFCHLGVYRTTLVREVGGFRPQFEGSQDYDLCLRCMERTDPKRIGHIPHILYHWRTVPGSTADNPKNKLYAYKNGKKALQEHFNRGAGPGTQVSFAQRLGFYRQRPPLPADPPLVSIIIPTRDHHQMLKCCLDSIFQKTAYSNYEILVVDNQSRSLHTINFFRKLARRGVRILSYNHPFNYSAINNWAVTRAKGGLLCFLNNDTEVISPEWLTEMVRHAIRPKIGAVGAKLLYPNGTLQHGGIVLGIGSSAGHAHKGLGRHGPGYLGRAMLVHNVSAVTAACLVVKKELFLKSGGFEEEHLKLAFNDVDLCLRIGAMGYRNLWTPYAELFHHESISRGYEDSPIKKRRFAKEKQFLQDRWGDLLKRDPFYNPNLSLHSESFELAWPPRVAKPWKA